MAMGKPGKTAPRLLQDLLTYDPRHEQRANRNLLTSSPPQFDPDSNDRRPAVSSKNCRHVLLEKVEQTYIPQPEQPFDPSVTYQVASFCKRCRFHFHVGVSYEIGADKDLLCQSSSNQYPLHHFVFEREEAYDGPALGVGGTHTAPRTHIFSCSAPRCPMRLFIRVMPPRITDADTQLLTDQALLRRRWEHSKQHAGDRADTAMARRVDAPDFLNRYLQDSLNPVQGKSRIPLLNRKFLKTFGKDCDGLLRRLGFQPGVELDQDGVETEVWHLPKTPPAKYPMEVKKPIFSERHIVEDARYELNEIILSFSEAERSGARTNPWDGKPSINDIEKILGCQDYDRVPGRTTRNTNHEEDHPYYAGLGTVGDFADRLLLFAYTRQKSVDPANHPYYFECLQDLAVGRKSMFLQEEVAMLASQDCVSRKDLEHAYRYFGIDPTHTSFITDEHIIGVFRSRMSDMGPNVANELRKHLRTIGQARDSEAIRVAANDTIETYEQALSWLSLEHHHEDDMVRTMYSVKTEENPKIARKAVEIIAQHRNSQRLRELLETGEMSGVPMDTADAYQLLGINDRTAPVDMQVLASSIDLMIEATPDMEGKYKEAMAIIERDQETTKQQQQPKYPLDSWPVGCANIGNTCYLNSVLQFLFTIKPLREMVLDCEKHMQDLDPEALEKKRVGRTAVSLARAETGQHFVRELKKLFEQMITSPTTSIRPDRTLAALALTRSDGLAEASTENAPEIANDAFIGPLLPPQETLVTGSRPPTPADSVMGNNGDAKSDTDSMKAMDLTASADAPNGTAETIPEPPSRPPPIPPRPQVSADTNFRKVEEVARQQDAAESINNVFDLLSCAFQGDGTLRDEEQDDWIKKYFFADVTTVRSKDGKETLKTDLQDTVAVTPKDRDQTLCAALDDEFGWSEAEPGVYKYEFFERLPPIQIFNARRLQFDPVAKRTVKNESHLSLDKTLYMDRYMKSTKSLSQDQLQDLRKQQWKLQDELRILDEKRKTLKETDFESAGKSIDLPNVLDETASFAEAVAEENDGSEDTAQDSNKLPVELRERAKKIRTIIEKIENRVTALEEEIDQVFANCKDHPYRLHAIFMHAGSASGGHYWIYIYDSQKQIWRKYNDETVSEESEQEILGKIERTNPPTSTGIVYVRQDVVEELTEAVHRKVEHATSMNGHTDVEMKDENSGWDTQTSVIRMDDEYPDLRVINGVEQE
ncbi:cysteine proteinase [Periconia macrospinosa]|uniref:ubiquitinyl hydrolase 1 n=1 Tax=Periconia macrospinosa TaxID=97972 RepID=A0A2V1E8T2_9PLEO|nr:cysteine proteinase [Periconia macrospinosa]